MSLGPVTFLFLIPALAAVVIALLPGSKLSAYVNAGASFLTFLAALSLLWAERPAPGAYVLVDEFNTIFVVLITFVAFTTSVFSTTYVEYELETGRVTPAFLKLYHALYQALTLSFVLALLSNNIGVMRVAIELATLTTVVMVGIYRTHAAIEAAWKYFILASVGIALALFGTILVYMAAEPVMGSGLNAMVWTDLVARAASLEPAMLNLAFVFLLLGYGTKIGLFPLHAWLPDAHAEGPTPITAVLSGLLLNVALYALLRCKMLLAGNPEALPARRQAIDLCLGHLHGITRLLAGPKYQLRAVALPHAPVAPLSIYRRFFGAPVFAEQPCAALHVSRETLRADLRGANPALRQITEDYVARHFQNPGESVTARVRQAVRRTLGTPQGDKTGVAGLLAIHPRTLQRHLAAEHMTFESIREEARKEAALHYLRETRVPLSQLAGLLGFSEQSVMTRSCRRWFGAPPSALRRS
jgi:AraC-like DNA-binding protein